MNLDIKYKSFSIDGFCDREILRYAGGRETSDYMEELLEECKAEIKSELVYKVCYRELDVSTYGNKCDFGLFELSSKNLADNLRDCKKVILFAATIGTGIDRAIMRYSNISLTKGLLFQAIGAERIEALCNRFCEDISKEYNMSVKPRFSPGYGDLTLDTQKIIFSLLECNKLLGLYLNESLVMSPAKSVTAFVGLK